MPETPQETILQLRGMIPSFDCVPGCHDCCGPHPWSRWEWEQVPAKCLATELTCPYVTPASCGIYEHRPIVCRLFGTVANMPCPHGRRPMAMLHPLREREIMERYLKLLEAEQTEEEHAGKH